MKKTCLFLFLFLAHRPGLSQSNRPEDPNNQTIFSQLTHVTVFLNRAQLTHVAKTTVNAGVTQLLIGGLPAGLDRQSLQVSGRGEVVILAVKSNVNYLNAQTKSGPVLRLEDSLQTARNELSNLHSLKDVLNKEQQMLMANQAVGGQQTGVTVERLQQMADFFRNRLTDIQGRLIKNEQHLVKVNERVGRLQRQLDELNAKRNQPTGEVVVSVSAKSRVPVELELNYLVNEAGWSPVYDLRAKDTRSPVQMNYKAYVQQNTGLNWEAVRLTLSTTNPTLGGTSPTLNPQYVSVFQPRPMKKEKDDAGSGPVLDELRGKVAGVAIDKNEPDVEAPPAPALEASETVADYTTVTESAIAVSFDIALPYTVASGGNPQLVDVTAHELPATYRHLAVPKLDGDAFLLAQVTGWEKYNLLSGNVNVYFEGTFVGESLLDVNSTRDTLDFSLGRDKKVVVKREKITDFSRRKTVGRNVLETVAYRITVRNTKPEAVQLTLEDQLPISRDSQVEVELLEAKEAEQNQETGKLTWRRRLNPNETQTLALKYSVKYPKGKALTGW
ncbi:MAG: DUF4139 domain-containing protein [Ferruginibacter sp.]|nr:DUF4139 domain-containing protein [Cytophagales bacterium]